MAEAKPSKKPPRPKVAAQAGKPVSSKSVPVPAKAARASAKAGKDKDEKSGGPSQWWEVSVQFLREVKTELRKVTWPARRQAVSSTGVVLALVALVSIFLGVVDLVLSRLVRVLIG